MKEDFLHYLWKFGKYDTASLRTTSQQPLTILSAGRHHGLSGPDFFNALIVIGKQKWAGNVEIHLKSSDWYSHHHERDAAYDSVILHVVWEHNSSIFRKDGSEIPTLELRHYVQQETVDTYHKLIKPKIWINCENQLKQVDHFVVSKWLEQLFFERLEQKSSLISSLLEQTHNDWEAVLFHLLAGAFGSHINREPFLAIAAAIPFQVIRKEAHDPENLEALLFGTAGLLIEHGEDVYCKKLHSKYSYLRHKYELPPVSVPSVQFFRLRPDNFPTIRLSQLANLIGSGQNLFSQVLEASTMNEFYQIFDISASAYWQNHYRFDRFSKSKRKRISKSFINLIVINVIVPLQFAFGASRGKELSEQLITIMESMNPEQNAILEKFKGAGITAENAFQGQSLLQLKKEYCDKGRCLSCSIGTSLLR